MEGIIDIVPTLASILIGALLTFFTQNYILQRQRNWERERIEDDIFNRNQDLKFQVYNKVLQLHGHYPIHEISHYSGEGDLYTENYHKYVRPTLFEIYHLLDVEVANEVDTIDNIFEKTVALGEVDEDDERSLSESYIKIINNIKKSIENFRETQKLLRKKSVKNQNPV